LLKTAKGKTDVLRSLQAAMRDIKQIKKKERDDAEKVVEKTCEVFINAIHKVTASSLRTVLKI